MTTSKLPVIIGGLGLLLMLIAVGITYYKTNLTTSATSFTTTEQTDFSRKNIKVDIEGAVVKPGIYELPNDSRIQDVLISAGGMTAKANRTYVSENINLAQFLFDGQKIFIPETGGIVESASDQVFTSTIGINTASESDLDTLPGIGPATAKKIIAGRPYQKISELIERSILTQTVYGKIKNQISIN